MTDTRIVGATPRLKKILVFAGEAAKKLGHDWLGVEHLMIGLAQEQEGLHAAVFKNLGITPQQIREQVQKELNK